MMWETCLISEILLSLQDPYTSRAVSLIDSRGCPVDPFVFPALGLSRAGDGIATNFNAFKIPESNFLVFEATVRTCRNGCAPVRSIGGRKKIHLILRFCSCLQN